MGYSLIWNNSKYIECCLITALTEHNYNLVILVFLHREGFLCATCVPMLKTCQLNLAISWLLLLNQFTSDNVELWLFVIIKGIKI